MTAAAPVVAKPTGGLAMPGYPDTNRYYEMIHFKMQEVIPPEVFAERGMKSVELMDWRVLYTLDALWELFNQAAGKRVSVIVNNWVFGGDIKYRGFRPPKCSIGANFSQHRFGRAADCVSPDVTASWMRQKLLENNRLFPYITYVEDDVEWLHFDVRASSFKGIHLFKP